MDQPLHPNLANIAVAYDEVMRIFRVGQISPIEARRRVLALIARDDNGLEWSICPDTGRWQYRSQFGTFVTAEPPNYGIASFTPSDIGGGEDRSGRITLFEVNSKLLTNPKQLAGSTMLPGGPPKRSRAVIYTAVIVGAVLMGILLLPLLTL